MQRVQDELKKVVFLIGLLASSVALSQVSSGRVTRVGETTHIELSGLATWNYEIKRISKNQIELILPAFDESTEVALRSWNDSLVSSVTIDKNGPDKRYVVTINLGRDEVEVFDYLTDDPSRLIVDLFVQEKPVADISVSDNAVALPEKQAPTNKKSQKNKISKNSDQYQKLDRKPAGSETLAVGKQEQADVQVNQLEEERYPKRGVWDGNDPDYGRFLIKDFQIKEESIIASEQNVYLRFPMVQMPFNRFQDLMKDLPEYEIVEKDTDQNKEARFLISLYKEKKFASFKKVYDFFMKKYPENTYDEIVRNLNLEMHIDKYLAERNLVDLEIFRAELKYLDEKYPSSPLRERNALLLGYSALMVRDAAEALRLFNDLLKTVKDPVERSHLQLGRALAYVQLRKPADAKSILSDLETTAASPELKVETAYRIGDVDLQFNDFKAAKSAYQKVLAKYPEYSKIFPNALYNLAESQFWLKEYQDSLKNYVEFLKVHPTQDQGGFAMTRAGEVLDILGADQSQVMSVFLESYFRYPKNEGADIARIRMLSQGFKGMKDKEKRLALAEIEDIKKRSSLPRVEEFVTLTVAEGRANRGEFRDSLKDLLNYYQDNPTTANVKVFKGRILRNISEILKDEIEQRAFLEALNFYGSYAKTWLKNTGRIDTEFFKAQAFEQAGIFAEAQKIYEALAKTRRSIEGTTEEKQRRVYEHLPSLSSIELRLAAVALEQKAYRDALQTLRRVTGPLSPVETVEKAQIGSEVALRMGDLNGAAKFLNDLIAGWADKPSLLAEPYVKLGRIYLQLNRMEDVATSLRALEALKSKQTEIPDGVWANAMELKAEMQTKRGEKLAAVETYLGLLEQFETKRPMHSVRYKAGLLLFEENDIKGAEKVWSALETGTQNFYTSLAKEKLEQLKWQDSYRKYVDRIPAAEQLR